MCAARLTTCLHDITHIIKFSEHSHEPNEAKIKAKSIMNNIYRNSESSLLSFPMNIYRDGLSDVTDPLVLGELTEKNHMMRNINKRQLVQRPNLPRTLAQLVIPDHLCITSLNQPFLQFDSGVTDPNRILIFYTIPTLRYLSRSNILFMDGTFRTVPTLFYMLYSIHGKVGGFVFPLIYVLMVKKNEQSYLNLFEFLKCKCIEFGMLLVPRFIMLDFEKATMNAISSSFIDCNILGCLFHYSNSIWSMACKKGFKSIYIDEPNNIITKNIRCILAMPFVPLEDITVTYQIIKRTFDPRFIGMVDYYEKMYIGKDGDHLAVFEPKIWNVYLSVLDQRERTNNVVEGWHNKFQKMAVSSHINVFKFIECLKKDQRDNEICFGQIESSGHTRVKHPISKKNLMKQDKIESLVKCYQEKKENDDIENYLINLSHKFKLAEKN